MLFKLHKDHSSFIWIDNGPFLLSNTKKMRRQKEEFSYPNITLKAHA